MQNPKHLSDKQNQKRPPVDWDGLGNEPRNENLAKIREPGSFEKKENNREQESEPNLLYRFNKHNDRGPRM